MRSKGLLSSPRSELLVECTVAVTPQTLNTNAHPGLIPVPSMAGGGESFPPQSGQSCWECLGPLVFWFPAFIFPFGVEPPQHGLGGKGGRAVEEGRGGGQGRSAGEESRGGGQGRRAGEEGRGGGEGREGGQGRRAGGGGGGQGGGYREAEGKGGGQGRRAGLDLDGLPLEAVRACRICSPL